MGSQLGDDQYPLLFSISVTDQELNTVLILAYFVSRSERMKLVGQDNHIKHSCIAW